MRYGTCAVILLLLGVTPADSRQAAGTKIGLCGPIGPQGPATTVGQLNMNTAGRTYENYVLTQDNSTIGAPNITFRFSEVRNTGGDGLNVNSSDALVDSCYFHDLIRSNDDAHGITGRPTRLRIHNTHIRGVTGDCLQFNPNRTAWDDVTVEHCELEHVPGVRGENAVDTKTPSSGRARLTIRNTVFHGFRSNRLTNPSALLVKERVDVVVENSVFYNNDVAVRARGPATLTLRDCYFYDSGVAVRYEDGINVQVINPKIGSGVGTKYFDGGGNGSVNVVGEEIAPPLQQVLSAGTGCGAAAGPPVIYAPASLAAGTVGVPYSALISASGTAPITWSVGGGVPTGMSIDSSGAYSGTPTAGGNYTFTVTATNADGSDSRTYTHTITTGSTGDSDGDGMTDTAETGFGFDPGNPDQDGNGVPDGQDDWDGDGILNMNDSTPGSVPSVGGGGGSSSEGAEGLGCGATGAEALLLLGWLAMARYRRR